MLIKTATLLQGLKATILAASDDDTRPHLCGIQMWRKGDRLNLWATDGVWVAMWQDIRAIENDTPKVLLPSGQAEFLIAVFEKCGLDKELDVEFNPTTGQVFAETFELKPKIDVESKLPDLESVIEATRERGPVPAIAINPRIFSRVSKAFRIAGDLDADTPLELSFGGSTRSPMLVTSEAVPFFSALLMPYAIGEPCEVEAVHDPETGKVTYLSKDTGEVVLEAEGDKQRCIPGTEGDAIDAANRTNAQAIADKLGVPIKVGDTTIVESKKRGRKS